MLSPCRATGVSACWAFFTLVPRCSWHRADALATLASPAAAAEGTVLRHARLGAGAAITILPRPVAFAVTLPAVTHSVTYKEKSQPSSKRLKNT